MTCSQDHFTGAERILAEPGEEYSKLQLHLDKLQRVRWIENLAPWRVMATFTFRWQAGIFSAQRCFEKTMRRRLPGVSYYEAIEANPGRDGYHVHSLWADCETVYRKRSGATGSSVMGGPGSNLCVLIVMSRTMLRSIWRSLIVGGMSGSSGIAFKKSVALLLV